VTPAAIVLFGAAGALGTRVRAALPRDREVIAVDRVLDPPCDAADPGDLARLLERLPPRLVAINVAGLVSTATSPDAVAAAVCANAQLPAVVAATLAQRLVHFVHLSSVSVYGPARANPIGEDHPLAPDTVYGVTKATGERLAAIACADAGVPMTVIRATQLFALASAHDTLPHTLTRRLRAGESPQLTADPRTRRDYLHVDDAARLIAAAALAPPRPGAFNAGSGQGVALGELFAVAYEAAGRVAPAAPPGGPGSSQWLDSTAARKAFDWAPREHVLDWIRAGAPDAG
jgi:UDP-glucose 4-epimerase